MNRLLLAALVSLPVVACGAKEDPTPAPGDAPAPQAETVALEEGEREVRCGCKIDSVGHCGNYVAEGDAWLEISNPGDFGLGHMEWCKVPADQHPKAVVAGTRTGDKVALTKLDTQ